MAGINASQLAPLTALHFFHPRSSTCSSVRFSTIQGYSLPWIRHAYPFAILYCRSTRVGTQNRTSPSLLCMSMHPIQNRVGRLDEHQVQLSSSTMRQAMSASLWVGNHPVVGDDSFPPSFVWSLYDALVPCDQDRQPCLYIRSSTTMNMINMVVFFNRPHHEVCVQTVRVDGEISLQLCFNGSDSRGLSSTSLHPPSSAAAARRYVRKTKELIYESRMHFVFWFS